MATQKWYRTDEHANAVDYLEMAASFYKSNLRHKWKWFTISLHSSLYGFAIINVANTDPDNVKNGSRLITAKEAITRCQQDCYMQQNVRSMALRLCDVERRAIKKLTRDFRNYFEHFQPVRWSIEIAAFEEIVQPVSRVIRFLALESGNARLTPSEKLKVRRALRSITRLIRIG
ncbi:MAG: hypothetical protein ACYDDI_02365 [Candidatus Acidiferrales bacterium]